MQISERIARRMKLHDLHLLLAVVQAGSMDKAAALLNMTQPAVSRSIAELERTLGVRLLDRSAQGVEPTAYGRVLLECGTAVSDDLRQAFKKIQVLTDPAAGEVRIGCNPWLAPSYVAAVIDRLARRYPRMEFRVMAPPLEMLRRELHERKVDVLVEGRLDPRDERSDFELLYEESYVVATSVKHPLARRRRIELAELVNELWTLPMPETVFGSLLRDAFRSAGFDYPRTTVFTHIPEVRTSLLTTGRYLTIFPSTVLRFPVPRAEIKVLPVALPMTHVPVEIVTLKNRMLGPAAQLFIQQAREVAKPLAERK
jgi:DNA-binding transcriptional LysR family regulator